MRLAELISDLDVRPVGESVDLDSIRICDLTEDSRTAVPGSLFIARRGTQEDGNRYIEPAIQCGCVAILTDRDDIELPRRSRVAVLVTEHVREVSALLAERFYGHPARSLTIVGVTGTNGKTTVAHLTHQLVESAQIRSGLIGTVEIDDGRERARASMTTPPAVEMSRTLATMLEHKCRAVVMEVSSHALDQSRAGALRFDAAAFTNLTGDHLDYHRTIDAYRAAKARLFGLLKPGALAAINTDDPSGTVMIDACARGARVVRCSMRPGATVDEASASVRIIDESIGGMTLSLSTPIGEIASHVPIFGAYNAMNILQSVLLAQRVMSVEQIDPAEQMDLLGAAIPRLVLPRGRLEHAGTVKDDLTVLVDFAHTDDALGSALGAIKRVLPPGSRLVCVFGCGGDRDATKRPRMGAAVASIADTLVVTSDNPRTEPPSRIIDEILSGIDAPGRARTRVEPDRARAIAWAIGHARPGDAVLIAGKGHETEQISPDGLGGTRTWRFDDREHAQNALRQRRLSIGTRATGARGA